MAKVNTNDITLAYNTESALGVPTTTWFQLEPNDITTYGATIVTTPRRPISQDRQRRKGSTTDLDSTVEFEHDLTMDIVTLVVEQYLYAEAANFDMVFRAADVTVNGYTIPAATANQAAKFQWTTLAEATLLFAQGYVEPINNGLKPLTADLAGSGTELTVSAAGFSTPCSGSSSSGWRSDITSTTLKKRTVRRKRGKRRR